MTTALQIINRAAEITGYKDPGEDLDGPDAASFIGVLNSMVDAWATEPLFVYAVSMLVLSVDGGTSIDTPNPVRIPAGGFFRVGTSDYPFEMITREQYEAFPDKSSTSAFPRYCYFEPGPVTGNLYFYPALSGTAELHLPIEQRLTEFADLSTDYTLMRGARAALEYSLAEELPGKLTQKIERLAMKYRRAIESFEAPILSTGYERQQGNILAGWQ